jgi:hypothetical protein
LGHMRMGLCNILSPLLDQATAEEKSLGTPSQKTLLSIAFSLVKYAPNKFTSMSTPSYSVEEKVAAKALLEKYKLGKLANLSARYKKATLELIEQESKEGF